jgi:hypothetical protein
MNQDTLPVITKAELDAVSESPSDYILLLEDRLYSILASDHTGIIRQQFTTDQNVLLAFNLLDSQVCHGGFIQLIENGYGAYIFDSALSEQLDAWGAIEISSIIDKGRIIYHLKKNVLERKKSLEEFAKLYQEHPEFHDLENQFNNIIDAERKRIKEYISGHIDRFCCVG